MQVWFTIAGLIFTVLMQTVFFAFYMGRQSETVETLKRRMDSMESKPIINHEAKLSAIDATLIAIKDAMEGQERRTEERLKALEGTFRNMVQLATSPRNS